MISLDKKIPDPASAVARRMIEYGKENELFILIPSSDKKEIKLNDTVNVFSTGGNRIQQYFRLKKMGIELIRKYDIKSITTQDPFFLGQVGYWLKKKARVSLEVQVHGDFFGSGYYQATIFWKIKIFFAKFVLHRADSVRTVGERVKQSLLKIGLEARKILVKPIMLNAESTSAPVFTQERRNFVWAGRMEPEKNLSFLVDVFSVVAQRKPESKLVLIGEGSEKESLQQKVKKLNLENSVTFVPWLSNPIGYIKNAQALLLPSLTESYGAVAMEANASGTSIIMNDVGVANYELKPSGMVTILPINDREAWINAILDI